MEAHGGLGMGEGATQPALEAQGVPGAGKGAHRGSGEERAWRQRGPSARLRMAPAAPRIPEPGQPGRGEQERRAEEGLRAQALGMTHGPAPANPGPTVGLECWGLVGDKGVRGAPRWLG